MRKLTAKEKSIGSQIVTTKTAKRSNDNATYYAVEFESIDNEVERSNQLAEFVNSNINGIYAARPAHTFDKSTEFKELPGEDNPEKLIDRSLEGEDF